MDKLNTNKGSNIQIAESEFNMVCNSHESRVRIYGRRNKQEMTGYFLEIFNYVFAIFASIVFVLITVGIVSRIFAVFGSIVIVVFFPFLLFVTEVGKFYRKNASPQPTNIFLSATGLKIATSNLTSTRTSQELSWVDVVFADVVVYPSASKDFNDGVTVNLCFDLSRYSFKEAMALKLQFMELLNTARIRHLIDFYFDSKRVSISIPLDLFTLEVDRLRLVSVINMWVKPSFISDRFKDHMSGVDEPSYTQLWLDDMHSSRRKRIEDLRQGSKLAFDRYEVEEKLSTGGQAQIYKAFDSQENRSVVLKEFVLPVSAGDEVRSRSFANVKNEALILSSLDSDGVIRLYDHFVDDHRAYLVLEYIEGQSLRELVKEKGRLKPDQVLVIFRSMLEILNYLHGQEPPVVHRDFTPDNLMLTKDGIVKLLDFNVAQFSESVSTKSVVGKHSYMAPEQFRGRPTQASDLYSLGCTLAYLLTGKDPVPLSQTVLDNQVIENQNLVDTVMRLTALKLDERYESAKDVLESFDKIF